MGREEEAGEEGEGGRDGGRDGGAEKGGEKDTVFHTSSGRLVVVHAPLVVPLLPFAVGCGTSLPRLVPLPTHQAISTRPPLPKHTHTPYTRAPRHRTRYRRDSNTHVIPHTHTTTHGNPPMFLQLATVSMTRSLSSRKARRLSVRFDTDGVVTAATAAASSTLAASRPGVAGASTTTAVTAAAAAAGSALA